MLHPHFRAAPQWITGSRLLQRGEGIVFHLYRPDRCESGPVVIFPRYLEQGDPGEQFVPGASPDWLDALKSESYPLQFVDGCATMTYRPSEPGNYMARWQAGGEVFYRYFSVVEENGVVLAFSTFGELESVPTLHATGIPLDYRLPIERFHPDDPLFQNFLTYHRHFGNTIVPAFPDTPDLDMEERVHAYGQGLETVRSLLPDAGDARSARIDMRHDLDPGYTETLMSLGVNDHCGLWEANAKPWLGMPEFPYLSSPMDCRKTNQETGGQVVAHQWDFCGGWHFLGPVSWHYGASGGQWERAVHCLNQGMAEARNLAVISGHPAFLTPLYDGVNSPNGFANGQFDDLYKDREAVARFVERYQRFMAFDMPGAYPLVYARSIDIADYYRRHFTRTPRTVFVSATDHVLYDMWWLCDWYNRRNLLTRERIPWETRISTVTGLRETAHPFKDPLSSEYLLVEDHRRSIRFERECPNPIWWFDYTVQTREPAGSAITHTNTPDVEVVRSSWLHTEEGWTITLKMKTPSTFPHYAIALWNIPAVYNHIPPVVETNADEAILAKNTIGEVHLVLCFDLMPDAEIRVTVRPAKK